MVHIHIHTYRITSLLAPILDVDSSPYISSLLYFAVFLERYDNFDNYFNPYVGKLREVITVITFLPSKSASLN